jgi:cyanophycin synthetase
MLPVGKFAGVKDAASALKAAEGMGYPLVLKPITGGKGDSVYVDLGNEEELKAALVAARVNERPYLMQSFFEGNDYRILVVGDAVVMAEQRIPAAVTGDGKHTVAELVEIENRNPERTGDNTMSSIVLDWESDRMLARQDCTRETILATGRIVRLKGMANVAKGGTSVTVTDIHPDNVRLAIRAARAIGLVVTGVDFICPDISKSWREVGGGICELNTTVGLPHERMTPGNDLRQAIVRAFFPEGDDGRIPTAMVTGTSGTTTAMMLARILAAAGHTVGTATAESVTIGEEAIAQGNFAGADGASIVLRDATVTAAVLETSRGGLIRTGTYLDRCDVSALLNVAGEQLDRVDTAAPERKVLDAARKAIVLNADDPRCLALAPEFAGKVRSFLFSGSADAPALRDHLTRGHDAFFLAAHEGHETIMAASGPHTRALLRTADLPTPPDGLALHHASAAMAAAALGIGLGIDLDTIRAGLMRYARAGDVLAARLPA